MSMMRPVGLYALSVPGGDNLTDADPELRSFGFRITMAAIDPTEKVKLSEDSDVPQRATLKLVRESLVDLDDDDSEDSDLDDSIDSIRRRLGMDGSDEDEELINGGPSDPKKVQKARREALLKALVEEDEEMELDNAANGVNGAKVDKGKEKAVEKLDDSDDEDDDIEEHVICTLDPKNNCQQALDISIAVHEQVYFKVTGGYTVHLTGNFVIPPEEIEGQGMDDEDSDDDDDEDDDDDLRALEKRLLGLDDDDDDDDDEEETTDSEDDELDDIPDPRVTEVDSDDGEAPKLVKTSAKAEKKGAKKRAAEDSTEETSTETMIKNVLKPAEGDEAKTNKPQAKKLKNNAGQAVPGASTEKNQNSKEEVKKSALRKESQTPSDKKVQFSKQLEQPGNSKGDSKANPSPTVIQGVKIEDKKPGSGPGTKKGDKVGMRYIGKLADGKVFDANKKGPPFTFTLGKGMVIKGWEIGVQGMKVGGERRIVIPAKLAYGNKSQPPIPPNSDLTFDLKLISIN